MTDAEVRVSTYVDPQGTAVITLIGDVDLSNAAELGEAVAAVEEGRAHRLVFDLTELRFIDSAGIALLVAATKSLADVRVRNPSPIVGRVIELTGLADVLPREEP